MWAINWFRQGGGTVQVPAFDRSRYMELIRLNIEVPRILMEASIPTVHAEVKTVVIKMTIS